MINNKKLFKNIIDLCKSGWHDLESSSTGAPGDLLEEILGIKTNNYDVPDSGMWELKFSRGNSLITLCHKTPKPKGIVKFLIKRYGWEGKNGRPSFRHTIEGSSERGFNVVYDSGAVWVRHVDGMEPVPHWTEEDLTNATVAKLRRLIHVTGTVSKRRVKYEHATAYEDIRTTKLMKAIDSGLILIDFDAFLKPNETVRDHGTKLRIKQENIGKLYVRRKKIC